MLHRIILLGIICIDIFVLLYQTSTISISAHEANLLYGEFSFIQYLEKISFSFFGQNDYALRLPMILLHILSIFLLFEISKKYIPDFRNRLWHIIIFILLPGVISSALMVDSAGLIIFGLLLFIYIYDKFNINYTYVLLGLFSIADAGFIYLFISLSVFAYYKKKIKYLFFNIVLVLVSIILYGVESSGSPEGHLLDAIGLYSAIFTPVIFIYVFYILYRRFLTKDINLLWFVATVPLLISLLLSFRQSIYIADFAPYFIVALPLAAQTFHSSYRVRLKMFRKKYKIIFVASFIFLLVNFFVVVFNRELYIFIENPEKHFARKMHIAKELSLELKKKDILCVSTESNMARRLNFYGISMCDKFLLYPEALESINKDNTVTISYKYRPIYKAVVTNINTQ